MSPHNHYEAAFEAFLRRKGILYIGIHEHRRNTLDCGETLKNLDFIITDSQQEISWLVDVKGRKFPGGSNRSSYWKHWTTHDDLLGMAHWQTLFGKRSLGLFVFAYWICGDRSPLPAESLFSFRNNLYAFIAIPWSEYLCEVRLISPRWKTYGMSTQKFRTLAKPFEELVVPSQK